LSIIRVNHDKNRPFVVVDKVLIQDKELSYEARGFLIYLLAKPDNWDLDVKVLAKETRLHFTTIYRLLKMLIGAGYVTKTEVRRCPKTGEFQTGVIYTVYEKKIETREKSIKILGREVPFE
jgi:hypothetical protein